MCNRNSTETESSTMSMSRTEVFAALASLGADVAVVLFSGGNDEGGPDSITLYRGEEELYALPTWHGGGELVAGADPELPDALSEPVFDAYGSFAGDFDVCGEVIWELKGEKVKIVKNERADYEHSEEYL